MSLKAIRTKLGDFWWYSLMLFFAYRFSDALNALVGLYLVPKYVDPAELGAVLPLTNFANALSFPIAVFSMVFMKEVNVLASRGEYGRLKSLMRSVFFFALVFLAGAIIASRLLLPLLLERIRIVGGSLGFLILASAFVGAVSPVYLNALQGMKKFTSVSVIHLFSGPLRFFAMVVAMPFRALSGYFVGQMAGPVFTIGASFVALRKELSVKAEKYWTSDILREFGRYFLLVGVYFAVGNLPTVVEPLVLRQRLPDTESGAYYILTRFSEISMMLSAVLQITIFPFASEKAERGESTRSFVVKSSAASLVFSLLFALPFVFFGGALFRLLPRCGIYADYAGYIPWLVGIAALISVQAFYTTAEISARRFSFLRWWIPLNVLYSVAMLAVSGYGYFTAYLPQQAVEFLSVHNIRSLDSILWWFTACALGKFLFSLIGLLRQRR